VADKKTFNTLDLFSGCGGMSLGLSWSSYKGSRMRSIGAVDIWDDACRTFEANVGHAPICGPVDEAVVTRILKEVGKIDVVVGGPPCQGFSTSGKRALGDRRNRLVRQFLSSVEIAGPKAFVMENVTGFTSFQNGRIFEEVVEFAENLGYKISAGVLMATRAGVPQRRRRFFMVGVRSGGFVFPNSVAGDVVGTGKLLIDQRSDGGFPIVTFDDATSDLSHISAGQQSDKYRCPPRNEFQKWARGKGTSVSDHIASRHSPEFVEMMSFLEPGESALDPIVAKRMPARIRPTSGFPNSYSRIRGNLPAPTITRNFTTPSSANCIHPKSDRALSLREGARCQSFPDWYEFLGNMGSKRLQIGNAVPPLLAKSLGDALLRALT